MPLWTPRCRRLYRPAIVSAASVIDPATYFTVSDKGWFFDATLSRGNPTKGYSSTGGAPAVGEGFREIDNLNPHATAGRFRGWDFDNAQVYRNSPFEYFDPGWRVPFFNFSNNSNSTVDILSNQAVATCIIAVNPKTASDEWHALAVFLDSFTAELQIAYNSSKQLYVRSRRALADAPTEFTGSTSYSGTWHVVTVVAKPSANSLIVRVNGTQVFSGTYATTGNFNSQSAELRIGNAWNVIYDYADGTEGDTAAAMGINKDPGVDLAGLERWFGQRVQVSW